MSKSKLVQHLKIIKSNGGKIDKKTTKKILNQKIPRGVVIEGIESVLICLAPDETLVAV